MSQDNEPDDAPVLSPKEVSEALRGAQLVGTTLMVNGFDPNIGFVALSIALAQMIGASAAASGGNSEAMISEVADIIRDYLETAERNIATAAAAEAMGPAEGSA